MDVNILAWYTPAEHDLFAASALCVLQTAWLCLT